MRCEFPNYEALSQAAAKNILLVGQRCLAEKGRFDLVLSGGKTPARTYEILAAKAQENRGLWNKTRVFWGDERCVPPDDPRSHYHMAKLCLLDPLKIPPVQIHRIEAEDPNPQEAARHYESIFPAQPDLLLLGMGEEGHTASLFPGSPALDETRRRLVPVEVPALPPLRITITPPVIAAARTVFVLASGSNKAEALRRVFAKDGDVHETPARLVRDGVWFVDAEAAKGIVEKPERS